MHKDIKKKNANTQVYLRVCVFSGWLVFVAYLEGSFLYCNTLPSLSICSDLLF